MSIAYTMSVTDEMSALTVFVNGQVKVATGDHPSWSRLKQIVETPDNDGLADELTRLLDPSMAVSAFFEPLSERVSIRNGHVYVDGDEISGALADHILRYIDEDNDPGPLVRFLENVLANPNEHSREQLYRWLEKHKFAITEEGNFLAYKGVRNRTGDSTEYPYESISQGSAIVDSQPYQGAIPNGVGAVVEMPRSEVFHDPAVGCNTGLHAGTWGYASNFSQGAVLLVEINPRDVVSVPTDCNDQKIRCCRYTVVEVSAGELTTSYYDGEDTYDDPYDDEEEDDWNF